MDTSVYNKLHNILYDASAQAHGERSPELSCLIAVIVRAAQDQDRDYFSSIGFAIMCKLCKIKEREVRSLCLKFIDTLVRIRGNKK